MFDWGIILQTHFWYVKVLGVIIECAQAHAVFDFQKSVQVFIIARLLMKKWLNELCKNF
jgi:hypothetical protein